MIITRTPFRVPLGGGGTDLPGFYKKHGGFIFSVTVNKYMYITVNRPALDSLIRVKYSDSETVQSLDEIKHDLAREALRYSGVSSNIEVTSFADLPAGTGMGSSASYLVGLLKALYTLQRKEIGMEELADVACHIEMDILKNPVGKQDQYLAACGGFVHMDIDTNGVVTLSRPVISPDTIDELESKLVMFFTNKFHKSGDILSGQNQQAAVTASVVEKGLLRIKEIGQEILRDFKQGNVSNYGKLMDEHWRVKKTMSNKMTDPELDVIYNLALASGAQGGKLMGSGGGGLFVFFCPDDPSKIATKAAMQEKGLQEMKYHFDFEGSKVLLNIFQQPH